MSTPFFSAVRGLVLPLVLLAGCLDVTDERTAREDDIGKGQTAGASFEVEAGLASVRRLEAGAIELWAGAPSLRIRARREPGAPAAWMLTLRNALPDAVLEVATGAGEPLPVTLLEQPLPTVQRWSFSLPPGVEATLAVRPARGEPSAVWRFALLSDVQEAIDGVQDIYRRMSADPRISFVVSSGDLTRRGAPDELERFQRELERLPVPFFSTLGNHELGTDDGEPFQRMFGRGNFRFVFGGMQFTFLDSASATLNPRVYDWLDGWLAEGAARPHAVLMHVPPIDPVGVRNGSFANRDEAAKLLARLAEGGVDLTLYGHIHSYYAFANAGIPAYISGGGGSIPERFDGVGRHYLTVDVDPSLGVAQVGLVRVDAD